MGNKTSFKQILSNDLCVGCGFCSALLPQKIDIRFNKYGAYFPYIDESITEREANTALSVCPFSDNDLNEDLIGEELFSRIEGIQSNSRIGYFISNYAGHVVDETARFCSASGGMISWLTKELMRKDMIDAVACVGPVESKNTLFEYKLITNLHDIDLCRKSRYYPVEVSEVIQKIKDSNYRVAFVGLPCFIKALHYFMRIDDCLRSKIQFTIGLICGHLKSKQYCEYLVRSCGMLPGQVRAVDFRKKIKGLPANQYAFEVTNINGIAQSTKMKDVFASSWSNNLFMLGACECCDDVVAETADVSIGDAWLPEFIADYKGTSIVITRNPTLDSLLKRGYQDNAIKLKNISESQVIAAQAGSFRQRRDGLRYRLYLRKKKWSVVFCKKNCSQPKGCAVFVQVGPASAYQASDHK